MKHAVLLTMDPPTRLGGQETLVRAVEHALVEGGYQTTVFHLGNSLPAWLQERHQRSRGWRQWQNLYVGTGVALAAGVDAVARASLPDVAMSFGTVGWGFVPARRRFHMYTGTYAGVAETSREFISYPGYLKLKYWDAHVCERLGGVHAHALAAGNQVAHEVLERFGQRCTQVWLPVDMERFSPVEDRASLRHALGVPADGAMVSWVGNAMPYKGLQTVAQLVKRTPDVHFLLVCRGGIPADVSALPNVTVMENVPYAELHRVYQASDGFLTPYRIGPFCFAMAEAMSCGVPVLCSPGAHAPDFLRGGPLERLVVPDQADVAGFAAALRHLVDHRAQLREEALALRPRLMPLMEERRWRSQLLALMEGRDAPRASRNAS